MSLPAGKSLFLPIRGSDADGDPISYSVSSDNDGVQVAVRQGHPHLRMTVEGFGILEFQLFDDLTPETVQQISSLVNQGFYDGLTFHRVIPDFMIQGGDPLGTGAGGPGFQFDDEFNPAALFTGNGQLAMANAGKDTNGSQFFVTLGPQRFLDFNHTIFGQLVRGEDVAEAIANVPRGANDRPTVPVVITDAEIVTNTADTVLFLRADPDAGPATITLTASDGTGESVVETFQVNVAADVSNSPPILGPIDDQATIAGTPLTFELSSVDLEGDPVEYQAILLNGSDQASVTVNGNQVTVTPQGNFTGSLSLQVGVKQQGATSRGSTLDPFDTQRIDVSVAPPELSAEGLPVVVPPGSGLLNTPVARFESTGGSPASAYSASITWGDGSTSAGTIVPRTQGGFEVLGTHTYASAGTFPIVVSITGPGESTVEAETSTVITEAPSTSVAIDVIRVPVPVPLGTNVSWTFNVRNTEDAVARNVTLEFILPPSVTFVSASINPQAIEDDVVAIDLGDLDPGEIQSIVLIARPSQIATHVTSVRVVGEGFAPVTAPVTFEVTAPTSAPPIDPDAAPARIVDLQRFGVGYDPTRIVLTFDTPMDPDRAEDVSNYQLILPGRDGKLGTRHDIHVPILKATYDEATQTVILEPRFRVPYLQMARLLVRSGPSGLADTLGRPLDGNSNGQAGGPFIARFGRGVYMDRAEVLRASSVSGHQGPIQPVVRTGGEAFQGPAIAPLFRGEPAVHRFLQAAGLMDAGSGSIAPTSTIREAVSFLPRGPLEAIRRILRRGS